MPLERKPKPERKSSPRSFRFTKQGAKNLDTLVKLTNMSQAAIIEQLLADAVKAELSSDDRKSVSKKGEKK